MTPQPCEQKENIEALFNRSNENKDKLHIMEVRQVEIAGDVKHIRSRIENGMGSTIHAMDEKLTLLVPQIQHHAKIVAKIEDVGWWISKLVILAVIISFVGLVIWAAANGWKP
jgi:aspartate carbamoyltransferase catalytic subunit